MYNAGEHAAPLQLYLAHTEPQRKNRTVFAQSWYFPANADDALMAGVKVALDVVVMLRCMLLRHEHGNVPAYEFAGVFIPKHTGCCRVGHFDDPPLTDRNNAV